MPHRSHHHHPDPETGERQSNQTNKKNRPNEYWPTTKCNTIETLHEKYYCRELKRNIYKLIFFFPSFCLPIFVPLFSPLHILYITHFGIVLGCILLSFNAVHRMHRVRAQAQGRNNSTLSNNGRRDAIDFNKRKLETLK